MPKIERRFNRFDGESIEDFLHRTGKNTGRIQAVCIACKACDPTLLDRSEVEFNNPEDPTYISAVVMTIAGDYAGTRTCPLVTEQN